MWIWAYDRFDCYLGWVEGKKIIFPVAHYELVETMAKPELSDWMDTYKIEKWHYRHGYQLFPYPAGWHFDRSGLLRAVWGSDRERQFRQMIALAGPSTYSLQPGPGRVPDVPLASYRPAAPILGGTNKWYNLPDVHVLRNSNSQGLDKSLRLG